MVPDEVVKQIMQDKQRRVLCTINHQHTMHSALMPSPEGYFIMMSKEVRLKLSLNLFDQFQVTLAKDESEYGMPMPEEFEEVMQQDEQGKQLFLQLTAGKKRSLLYMIGKVKNVQSRINKSLAVMEHLKECNGKLDYKLLNAKIKEYNSKY